MLKSIDFIQRLENDLNNNKLENFFVELRINQKVYIYIVSDSVSNKDDLSFDKVLVSELKNSNIRFTYLTIEQSQEDEYKYLFENKKVSFGLRRSLGSLLTNEKLTKKDNSNIVTFFSYKGGVGRTTALALTATYLARQGKKVFILDCDFEAPGLLNFFNLSQEETPKNGLVEYFNDQLFAETKIENYIYDIEKAYSGTGVINLMPAGNIFSSGDQNNLDQYLEGIAKIDLQGIGLINTFEALMADIQLKYAPDVIMIDSRTGFNNIFGALAQLSEHVVILAGDDVQNLPGLEYVTNLLKKKKINTSFILSILSGNFSQRFKNFKEQMKNIYDQNADVFYFDRQNTLEFIGTSFENSEDIADFTQDETAPVQYAKFFKHIEGIISENVFIQSEDDCVANTQKKSKEQGSEQVIADLDGSQYLSMQDKVLNKVKENLPDLYAENIVHDDAYLANKFYIRPCMVDFLIPEKVILLGDKGTGKTAFYHALQNKSFFETLQKSAQKKHLNYSIFNVTNFENDSFEFLGFKNFIKDELFLKKFWMFFIWNAIVSERGGYRSQHTKLVVDLNLTNAATKIINIINEIDDFNKVEDELIKINDALKAKDERLILTFDRLDNIVKPYLWNDVISPLVKLCILFPFGNICPKLFLRRDLYERLGNLTNKNSFSTRSIKLEWSQNEIFSYFLKIVFINCKEDFFKFLQDKNVNVEIINKKLSIKGVEHNQLPLDEYLIRPVVNDFFGQPRRGRKNKSSTAYDDLYRNIQSADKTVNLRPFIDLIRFAIVEQEEQDSEKKFRKEAVLGVAYCTSKNVRKKAVEGYLNDLWSEQGNEFVKYFCEDIATNKVHSSYKTNFLNEDKFEKLLQEVKNYHKKDDSIKNRSIEDLKQVLIANKIMNPYMVGNKTRYGYAFLYTNFLGI